MTRKNKRKRTIKHRKKTIECLIFLPTPFINGRHVSLLYSDQLYTTEDVPPIDRQNKKIIAIAAGKNSARLSPKTTTDPTIRRKNTI